MMLLPLRKPKPAEPDPVDDWIPGYHPILDLLAAMTMLTRNQEKLAHSVRRSWFLWGFLAVAWVVTAVLNLVFLWLRP